MRPVPLLPALALAATVVSPAFAAPREWRGRVLVRERTAPGVTVEALPYLGPSEAARRQARGEALPGPLGVTTTKPDGTFVLVLPKAATGLVELRFRSLGTVPVAHGGVYDVEEGEDLGDVTLPAGEALAGRVVDAAGKPVPNARVTVLGLLTPGEVAREVKTAADGAFVVENAAPRRNRIVVVAPGLAVGGLEDARAGALARPIPLGPAHTLTGTALRSDGRAPSPRALVRVARPLPGPWVEADDKGAFRLAAVPAGAVTLEVEAHDGGRGEARVTAPSTAPVRLVASPPTVIEGRVVDASSGAAVPRVRLELKEGSAVAVARSGPDGRYRFPGLAAGRYDVSADEPRHVRFVRTDVAVAAGETRRVDVALTRGATLAGRVVDEAGAPVSGATGRLAAGGDRGMMAVLRQVQDAGPGPTFRTAADGSFRLTRVGPGTGQRLVVNHPEYEDRTVPGIDLAAGGQRTGLAVVLRRGLRLAGTVVTEAGDPLGGVEVRAQRAEGGMAGALAANIRVRIMGGEGAGSGQPRAVSGPDGRFELRGLSAGEYSLQATREGYATRRLEAVRVAEGADEPVEIVLSTGASIAGVVRRPTGDPVANVVVTARGRGDTGEMAFLGRMSEPTGADGVFRFDGLVPGEAYDLQVLGRSGLQARRTDVRAPADAVDLTLSATGQVAGTVTDAATSEPLRDFEVSCEPPAPGGGGRVMFNVRRTGRRLGRRLGIGEDARLTRGDDGAYVLDEVPVGTCEVHVESPGYASSRLSGIKVEDGRTTSGVDVRLSRGAILRGQVVDASTSRPVPGASVSASSGEGVRGPALALLGGDGTLTDADGRYEIGGLEAGRHRISVRHADYAEAVEVVEAAPDPGTGPTVRLSRGGSLSGTVVTTAGQPVPGASVDLMASGEAGFMGGGGQETQTDDAGRFRFDRLQPGRYRLRATVRGGPTASTEAVLAPGSPAADAVLTVAGGARLRGRVTGLPDAARGAVTLMATGREGYAASGRAAADGSFEFAGVPAGPLTVRATSGDLLGGQRSAVAQTTIAEGQTEATLDVVFEGSFSIAGRVTRRGAAVPGVLVVASLRAGGGRNGTASTDESGRYRVEGLVEGTYMVSANPLGGGGGPQTKTAEVKGDTTVDFEIPTARLAGVVVESGSRQPLPDATVEVVPAGGSGGAGIIRIGGGLTTDSNGRFTVEELEPRTYTVTIRRAGFQVSQRDVAAAEAGTDTLTFELTRGQGIGLQVKDGVFGLPLRSVTVRATDAANRPVYMGPVTLDGEGRGEVPSLPAGTYTLKVGSAGYAWAVLGPVTVPSPALGLALTPGGALEIRAGTRTPQSATVRLQLPNGTPYPSGPFGSDAALPLGGPVRLLEHVAPGTYTLLLDDVPSQMVTIREGATTTAQLP